MSNEIDRLRALNAELKEAKRNLEVRLNAELRDAAAEIGRLRAEIKQVAEAWYGRCVVIDERDDEIERLRVLNAGLLAALQAIVPNLEECVLPGRKDMKQVRVAIAKAESK